MLGWSYYIRQQLMVLPVVPVRLFWNIPWSTVTRFKLYYYSTLFFEGRFSDASMWKNSETVYALWVPMFSSS